MITVAALWLYMVGVLATALRASDDEDVRRPIVYSTLWPITTIAIPLILKETEHHRRYLLAAWRPVPPDPPRCRCNGGCEPCPLPPSEGPMR